MNRHFFMKQLIDIIGPGKFWPKALWNLVARKFHINNEQRFKLTVFFLCNGVAPHIINGFYRTRYRKLDNEAWRQIAYLIKAYPGMSWTAWNVYERRSM